MSIHTSASYLPSCPPHRAAAERLIAYGEYLIEIGLEMRDRADREVLDRLFKKLDVEPAVDGA